MMRKQPQQARSEATIEAVLQAAAHILGQRGWRGLTTNAVADAAGVSVGSLYQYFPNKLALVEAVRQRHFGRVLDVMRVAESEGAGAEAVLGKLVDGLIAAHGDEPELHRILLEEVPRAAGSATGNRSFEEEV